MLVSSIKVRNFRCFEAQELMFEAPVLLVSGENGSGKTSLLEAIFYASSLRSFKTRFPREMVCWGADGCIIELNGGSAENDTWTLKICITKDGQRAVKLNGNTVDSLESWHEIARQCKTIALSEEDLLIVSGAPEERRRFIDHAISLNDPSHLRQLVLLKRIVRQKSSLLCTGRCTQSEFVTWTEQLDHVTEEIRSRRKKFIETLQNEIVCLLPMYVGTLQSNLIELSYQETPTPLDRFSIETAAGRTLFGAHIDDLAISYAGYPARQFASRGQQKFVAFLLKMAAISLLKAPSLILVDDFMTDFDRAHGEMLAELARGLGGQLIFTAPQPEIFTKNLQEQSVQKVTLKRSVMPSCKKDFKNLGLH